MTIKKMATKKMTIKIDDDKDRCKVSTYSIAAVLGFNEQIKPTTCVAVFFTKC